jgi:hypothetical protein
VQSGPLKRCVVQRLPKCGVRPTGGSVGPLGRRVVYMRDIFILNETWEQNKIYTYFIGSLLG